MANGHNFLLFYAEFNNELRIIVMSLANYFGKHKLKEKNERKLLIFIILVAFRHSNPFLT
jgi:hypothetical protein